MEYPSEYRKDIHSAVEILKKAGCNEIYLFGSLTDMKKADSRSDIDFAVKGLSKDKFFSVYGRLLSSLEHPVDLVSLDYDTPFAKIIIKRGNLHRVA